MRDGTQNKERQIAAFAYAAIALLLSSALGVVLFAALRVPVNMSWGE